MSSAVSDAQDTVARTLWGEARGEGRRGQHAVANVIARRVAHPRWWGRDWITVCRAPWQFSTWNPDDVNLPQILAVTTDNAHFRISMEVAALAIEGRLENIVANADHFHTHRVNPVWSRGVRPVAIIGNHRFFRLST